MNWQFWSRNRSSEPDVCAVIRPLLSLRIDGMATPHEECRIESHLAGCEGCQQAYHWISATQVALAQRTPVLPPVDMHERIARAIAASTAAPVSVRPVRRPLVRQPAFAAMTMTVAAVLGYGYWSGHHSVKTIAAKPPIVASKSPSEPTLPSPFVTPAPTPARPAPVTHPHHVLHVLRLTPDNNPVVAEAPKETLPAGNPAPELTAHVRKSPLAVPHKPILNVQPPSVKLAKHPEEHRTKPIPLSPPSLDSDRVASQPKSSGSDDVSPPPHRLEQPDVAPTPVTPETPMRVATNPETSNGHPGLIRLSSFAPSARGIGVNVRSRMVNTISHAATADMSTDGVGFQSIVGSALH